jgi:hypothetical protein
LEQSFFSSKSNSRHSQQRNYPQRGQRTQGNHATANGHTNQQKRPQENHPAQQGSARPQGQSLNSSDSNHQRSQQGQSIQQGNRQQQIHQQGQRIQRNPASVNGHTNQQKRPQGNYPAQHESVRPQGQSLNGSYSNHQRTQEGQSIQQGNRQQQIHQQGQRTQGNPAPANGHTNQQKRPQGNQPAQYRSTRPQDRPSNSSFVNHQRIQQGQSTHQEIHSQQTHQQVKNQQGNPTPTNGRSSQQRPQGQQYSQIGCPRPQGQQMNSGKPIQQFLQQGNSHQNHLKGSQPHVQGNTGQLQNQHRVQQNPPQNKGGSPKNGMISNRNQRQGQRQRYYSLFTEIYSHYISSPSLPHNLKLQFDLYTFDKKRKVGDSERHKIAVTIVSYEKETNKRISYIRNYISMLELGTIVQMIESREFQKKVIFGGGWEREDDKPQAESKCISRVTELGLLPDGKLQIQLKQGPGLPTKEGGFQPDKMRSKEQESLKVIVGDFHLKMMLYRLRLFIEHQYFLDLQLDQMNKLSSLQEQNQ